MNINDLRIGNLVFFKGNYTVDNEYFPVNGIFPIASLHTDSTLRLVYHVEEDYDTIGCYHVEDIYPVSLTEEWLLKLGFIPTEDSDCFKSVPHFHIVFEVNFFKKPDEIYIDICCLADHNSPHEYDKCIELAGEFKYVHQLQNLYYIHTGKELILKEPVINA